GSTLAAFLDRFDTGSLGVNLDPANLLLHGFDPYESIQALGRRIVHAHAKDARQDSASRSAEEVPLGHGDIDWMKFLGVLEEVEYRGWLTIERETGQSPGRCRRRRGVPSPTARLMQRDASARQLRPKGLVPIQLIYRSGRCIPCCHRLPLVYPCIHPRVPMKRSTVRPRKRSPRSPLLVRRPSSDGCGSWTASGTSSALWRPTPPASA